MDNLYDVNLDGIGRINGGSYKNIKVSGVCKILTDIICENTNIEGVCEARGNIKCNDITIEGTFTSKGSIEADNKINIRGYIKLGENIQGLEVNIEGKVEFKGFLSGDKVKILFIGKNRIKEIGGEEITILPESKSFINGTIFSNKLVSDLIEGDNITLENTECDTVRGKNVTIKAGCKIKVIEYSEEISINESSKVENIVKL